MASEVYGGSTATASTESSGQLGSVSRQLFPRSAQVPDQQRDKAKLTFNFAEAGEQIGCSAKTIARMVAKGQIKTILVGAKTRIPGSELERIWRGGK